jgi:hypothetical protein
MPTALEFKNPPALFRPGYFWLWNDVLNDEALQRQLRDMWDRGAGSVCPHPMPPEFRPDSMAMRMHPEYLGEEYFGYYRRMLESCRKLGMHCILYDEGGWPSGGACGRVYATDPDRFACKTLEVERHRLRSGETRAVPPTAHCGVLETSGHRRVLQPGEAAVGPDDNAILWLFHVRAAQMVYGATGGPRHAPYVDVLCPDAVKTFLRLTHARYADHAGDLLGTTIRVVFTDEPAAPYTVPGRQLTWTADMAAEFKRRMGYDLDPRLPDLFRAAADDEAPDVTATRIDFYDVWSRMLVDRFLAPVRSWCRDHGVWLGGHFGGEHDPLGNAAHGYGHILRALRGLDVPGVDAIWRQVFPGRDSVPFPLYAASVAAQKAVPLVLTESFAVYGAGLTVGQMKWIADSQLACGATLVIPSNYPYSTEGHLMRFCRPQFGPHNPLWEYMDIFHDHTARLGHMLSRGKSDCRTAVYYGIRDVWAGGRTASDAVRRHAELCKGLMAAQREFEFIDDDVLAGREGRVEDGILRAGAAAYETIIVPTCRWMEAESLRGLADFTAGGGTVIAVNGMPHADGGRLCLSPTPTKTVSDSPLDVRRGRGRIVLCSPEQAVMIPPALCTAVPPQPDVRARRRVMPGGSLYFIFNEGEKPLSFAATFEESSPPVLCDVAEGSFLKLPCRAAGNSVEIHLDLPAWGSVLVGFGFSPVAEFCPFKPLDEMNISDGWTLTPLRSVSSGRENWVISDLRGTAPVAAALGDWRTTLGPYFSGEAMYAASFCCSPERARRRAMLDMGDVRYACEVFLNGRRVGRRAWAPFVVDLEGAIRPGDNRLEIRVTNTLANAVLDPQTMDQHSRVTGTDGVERELAYESVARSFERESLASGLFGPIRILFE